jgi:hypothetical protein
MKIRCYTSSPADTEIPAGDAGNYFGRYLFKPCDDPKMLECDVKDTAAVEFFLSTGNFFPADAAARKVAAKVAADDPESDEDKE